MRNRKKSLPSLFTVGVGERWELQAWDFSYVASSPGESPSMREQRLTRDPVRWEKTYYLSFTEGLLLRVKLDYLSPLTLLCPGCPPSMFMDSLLTAELTCYHCKYRAPGHLTMPRRGFFPSSPRERSIPAFMGEEECLTLLTDLLIVWSTNVLEAVLDATETSSFLMAIKATHEKQRLAKVLGLTP